MSRFNWGLAIAITAAVWIFALVVYPRLPEEVPTHWNIRGEIDAWGHKSWAAFLTPGAMTLMLALFRVLPWLSPKHFELDTFRKTYDFIVLLVMALFAYLGVLLILPGLGVDVRIDRSLLGGVCLFFMLLGNVLGKVQRNFFVGVRTPWTLASDRVWADTHRVAAWVFVGMGLVGLVAAIAGTHPLISITAIILGALGVVLFSLVRYKQLERRGML
jgi:uncharacterized membrane protein